MRPMLITDALHAQYRRDGFILLKNYFHPGALQRIIAEADAALERVYGPSESEPTRERAAITMDADSPLLSAALEQPALYNAAYRLGGKDLLGFAAYVASHVGDTGWHADSPEGTARGVHLAFYVEPTTRERGALQFVPGSHKGPLHQRAAAACAEGGDPAAAGLEVVCCESQPGDMIVFDRSVFHGAFGGWPDRRVVNLLYFDDATDAAEGARTRASIADARAWLGSKCSVEQEVFTSHWLSNRDRNPLRAGWIKRLVEIGVLAQSEQGKVPVPRPDEALEEPQQRALQAQLPEGWTLVSTSSLPGVLRITLRVGEQDVIVLLRPGSAPNPRAFELGGVAWGYNTAGNAPLSSDQMVQFRQFAERVEASLGAQLRSKLVA